MSTLKAYHSSPDSLEICVDEAGRGSLAFPVFIGAVVLKPGLPVPKELKDSKQMTKLRKAKVRQWIEENALYWTVKHVDNKRIDQVNILNATHEGMQAAIADIIEQMKPRQPDAILIDGNSFAANTPYSVELVVKGDSIYAGIAAASVLAKEHHDEYIRNAIDEDPMLEVLYDLSHNVGYGSARHIEGIREYGPSPYHRMSFACCRTGVTKRMATQWTINSLLAEEEKLKIGQQVNDSNL